MVLTLSDVPKVPRFDPFWGHFLELILGPFSGKPPGNAGNLWKSMGIYGNFIKIQGNPESWKEFFRPAFGLKGPSGKSSKIFGD